MPYSNNRTIEVPTVVAAVLWVASTTLFVLAGVVGVASHSRHAANMAIGASLIVAGIACCATVRVMLINHYRVVRDAFNMGREVGQQEAGVPLQRVR